MTFQKTVDEVKGEVMILGNLKALVGNGMGKCNLTKLRAS